MNISYPYLAELEEDNRFFVHFIDIEEAFTQADSLEEAAFNASEVLTGVLACRLEDNDEIPEPSSCPENGFMASPGPKIQAALLLRKAMGNKRLENPDHWTSLKQLDKAAKTLGKRLILTLE